MKYNVTLTQAYCGKNSNRSDIILEDLTQQELDMLISVCSHQIYKLTVSITKFLQE